MKIKMQFKIFIENNVDMIQRFKQLFPNGHELAEELTSLPPEFKEALLRVGAEAKEMQQYIRTYPHECAVVFAIFGTRERDAAEKEIQRLRKGVQLIYKYSALTAESITVGPPEKTMERNNKHLRIEEEGGIGGEG